MIVALGLCNAGLSAAVAADAGAEPATASAALLDSEQSIHITAVEYVGNKVSKSRLLNQQLYFSAPATVTGEQLAKSVQSIRDLGLFESVVPELVETEQGYVLRITIDEKFYIIPLPRLGLNSDGETSYGASLEWDNIGGYNQRLKFVWERKQLQDAKLGEREVLRLQYDYPRVAGTLWNGGFFTRNERVPVKEAPADGGREYLSENQRHGISVGRQLSKRGQTQGWFMDGQFFYLLEDNTPHSLVPELAGGSTWAIGLGANYQDRHLRTYTEEGVSYGISGEISVPIGSPDFSYNRISFDWRMVSSGFEAISHDSFIYRAGAGIYNGGIEGLFAFGNNSDNLRGLKKGELEGNAVLYASAEYLLPVHHSFPSWRYGGFVDVAMFADDYTNFCACDLTYSVGLALVWRPRKLVKVELRAEYGHNVDSKTSRAGGGLTRF